MTWQPIGTAPTGDGDLLLFRVDEWGDADILVGWRSYDGWRYNVNGDDPPLTPHPTHWMPLPEPPQTT